MNWSDAVREIYSSVVTINDKTCTDKDGKEVTINESLVNAKISENEYKEKRKVEYPDIGDQLDDLYHAGVFSTEMTAKIKEIKVTRPKPKETRQVLKDLYKTRNFAQDIEGKKSQDEKQKVEKEKSKGLMSKEGDDK